MTTARTIPALGVVILAAGASSRMGRPKLLLPWAGSTIVSHLISQWRGLGTAQIAIVGRPDDEKLMDIVNTEASAQKTSSIHYVVNLQPERGMFSSIVCAASWNGWQKEISHWAVTLGDQPHLREETLRRLLDFVALHPDAICQPAFNGKTAHPVVLPREAFETLRNTRAQTLKEFLKLDAFPRVQLEIEDPGLALDLDTPEDYIQAQGIIPVA